MFSTFSRLLHSGSLAFCLSILPAAIWAQVPDFGGQPGQKQERTEINGSLTAAQGKLIKVKNGNDEWILRVDSKPEDIVVRGEAEKGWVRPGMFVHFEATLDKKGFAQEPVKEVSIFTPGQNIELGITEAGAAGFSTEEDSASAEEAETATYTVVGRLASVTRDGRWSITAGRDRANVEVADDAKISVEVSDPTLIRIGDKVKGTVYYYNKPTGILRGQVEVEAVNSFTAPEENTRARRPRRGRNQEPEQAKSVFDQ